MANGTQIQLSDLAPITVRSPEIVAGQAASLTLTFATAGVHPPVRVAIADGTQPQYASITPAPAPRPALIRATPPVNPRRPVRARSSRRSPRR